MRENISPIQNNLWIKHVIKEMPSLIEDQIFLGQVSGIFRKMLINISAFSIFLF